MSRTAYAEVAKLYVSGRPAVMRYSKRLAANHWAARKKGLQLGLTLPREFAMMVSKCTYCGRAATPDKPNGIDRRDNSRGYTEDNCTPCCHECNYAKRSMTEERWLAWIDRIVAYRSGRSSVAYITD